MGSETVVAVMYHMSWPSPGNDPWYLNNTTENNARRTYYNVNGIPNGYIDGITNISSYSNTYLTNTINSRSSVASPYEIEVSGDPATASVSVTVKATMTPPSGSKYLRIAVVEKEYNTTIPFPNGTTRHLMCMLDMVPDALGTLLNIAVGDSQTFNYNYNTSVTNLHPPQDLESLLTIVAFIQNDQNKEVLQAGYAEVGISTGILNSSAIIQTSETAFLEGYLYNRSESQMDLDLGISGQIPAGWAVSASCPQGTVPVNAGNLTVTLAGSDSLKYSISVDPQGNSGSVFLDAHISLSANPSLSSVSQYFVTTNDVEALVVDASDEGYGAVLQNSLESVFAGTYGFVNREALEGLSISLDNIKMIFWSAGNNPKAFFPDEVSALQNFLDNGGNLFITGQEIGDDIFGTSATSQHAQSFYNNYLHANFQSDFSNWLLINGFDGDPITNGIQFPVSTSIYERNTDIISPYDAQATSILKYFTGPDICGIRATGSNYRIVYISMGFEQINDAADRDSILVRSIRWFEEGAVGIEDDDLQLLTFELAQNYPNPFNPETVIKYSLDNHQAEQTTLIVYNALGQVVRRLVNEPQTAGNYEVTWNARDNFGHSVASGIYYYHLKSAQNSTVQKMVLVR